MVGLLLGEVVSIQKNIFKKDVVGLLLGEVVSMKKKILAKDMVDLGLLATSSRCTSEARACQVEATSISIVKRV